MNNKTKTQKTFTTSDIHVGHDNILKFNPATRPWKSADEMNEALIANWNSVVSPNDRVFDLGDLSFTSDTKTIEFLEQLNGEHHLVLGNHDQRFARFKNGLLRITPFGQDCLDAGLLKSIQSYVELYHGKRFVVMHHYGARIWNKAHHGAYYLYGHSHGKLPGISRSMDVGIDSSDMPSNGTPFLLDDVLEFLSPREPLDHH